MKKISIIHWDDEDRNNLSYKISSILKDHEMEIENYIFNKDSTLIEENIKTVPCDLIILDIEENKQDRGYELLNLIVDKGLTTPILIYSKFPQYQDQTKEIRDKFNLNMEFLDKKYKNDPIKYDSKVREKIQILLNLENKKINFRINNDFKTVSALQSIGEDNLQVILGKYFKLKNIPNTENVFISALTPGLSGAYILSLKFGVLSKLVKITKQKDVILKEYDNLQKYYADYLRSICKVDYENISPEKLNHEGWYAIIYEIVPFANTLFSFLNESSDKIEIEKILSTIFSTDGLAKLYQVSKSDNIPVNKIILDDITPTRTVFILNSIKTLEVILANHKQYFDEILIKQIVENKAYGNILASEATNSKEFQLLSHADLHSDNIVIDNNSNPIIIDPGNIDYKHWSNDISRLIVDLFIRGYDCKNIKFYELNSINDWFDIAINIIEGVDIVETNTAENSGFILAINWLRQNIKKIHSDLYSEWEFQLGLALEFLKASYKSISIPPTKRALALLAACEAVRKSSGNFIIKEATK